MNALMITPRQLTARCGVSDYSAALLGHLRDSGFNVAHLSPDGQDLKDLVRRVRLFSPDIMHMQHHCGDFQDSCWPVVIALLAGLTTIPLVTTFHDLPWRGRSSRISGTFRTLAWVSRVALFTNRYDLSKAVKRCPEVREKANLVPVGPGRECILPEIYDRRAYRRRLGVKPRETLLLYFGFLRSGKGVEQLLEAVSNLLARRRAVKLFIIGDLHGEASVDEAEYAREMRRLASGENLAGQVVIKGYLAPDEVSGVLRAADIGVLPFDDGLSAKRSSFFTLVRHGVPTISTRGKHSAGPLAEMAAPFLVPDRDADCLTAILEKMIDDRPSFAGAWQMLKHYVRDNHGWPAIVKVHKKLYQKLEKVEYSGGLMLPGSVERTLRSERRGSQ